MSLVGKTLRRIGHYGRAERYTCMGCVAEFVFVLILPSISSVHDYRGYPNSTNLKAVVSLP